MKELSIEEKAKAYDEVRDKIALRFGTNVAKEIFSQFEESDNERIRKALIKLFKTENFNGYVTLDGIDIEDVLTWLEKHGEQKSIDEIAKEVSKDKTSAVAFLKGTGIMNEKGELADEYRQSEQKTTDKIEPKFKVGQTIKKEGFNIGFTIVKVNNGFYYNDVGDHFPFTDQDNWELVEQNPVWNEEDDIMVHDIDYALRCQITYPISKLQSISNWIQNLKDRVQSQPKQEWSEKDEKMYNVVHDLAWESYKTSRQLDIPTFGIINDWLKSLKPQNTWKPSNEQMEGIECTIKTLRYQLNAGDNRLDSLYKDLKKLREE